MTYLFTEPFSNLESERKKKCIDKISTTQKETFLSNEEQKMVEHFYEYFELEKITLQEPHIEENIIHNELTLSIPIETGDWLLRYRPQTCQLFWISIKQPTIDVGSIVHKIKFNPQTSHEQINKECQYIIDTVNKNVNGLNSSIDKLNIELRNLIETKVKEKIGDIKKTSDIISKLNIKLKRRENAPRTYVVPVKRKRIELLAPKIDTETPFGLEPTLSNQTYDDILNIIHNMAQVMERSPSTFVNMKEEDLRIHFLVQLNGQYEGEAMGEVFNLEGRTDILIRHQGANIFVAECKFWNGREGLLEAIDQLLGYVTWRDTKTAIILFNRNREISKVLNQIPQIVKDHRNFKEQLSYGSENGFRFILSHKDDRNRNLYLTILVFEVPQ